MPFTLRDVKSVAYDMGGKQVWTNQSISHRYGKDSKAGNPIIERRKSEPPFDNLQNVYNSHKLHE
jgi:hypothetical protein